MSGVLQRTYADPECGCKIEEWLVDGVCLTLHFELDGSMEVYADTGEWDAIIPLKATTMEAARAEAFAWVNALPHEGQINDG